jgi:hypothetical protein
MPSFEVAHLREQGQDMLLFALDGATFHHKTDNEQSGIVAELEARAHAAGLAGSAAAFWNYGSRGYFRGPRLWHSYLSSINTTWVAMRANKTISWS